jgi:uncharacterized protein YcbK (DUF882 family)
MLALAALLTPLLLGDINHVVAKGHTIQAIAHRYHVSVKAIVEANHLKDPAHLKLGQVLVIPGVDGAGKKKGEHGKSDKADKAEKAEKGEKGEKGGPAAHGATASLEPQPEPRGPSGSETIHAVRAGEEFHIHVKDAHGHIPSSVLSAFERLMRQGNAVHPPDPRLVALIGIVSSHFGGKPIDVVSGYRAYTPTQYTPHSNHNLGRALDFRVRGVANETLWAFCRTLRNAGCGYYPNSTFVHLDVRDTKTFWIDRSRPGEPPKYDSPDGSADETTNDVPNEPADPQETPTPQPPAAGAPAGQEATPPREAPKE